MKTICRVVVCGARPVVYFLASLRAAHVCAGGILHLCEQASFWYDHISGNGSIARCVRAAVWVGATVVGCFVEMAGGFVVLER